MRELDDNHDYIYNYIFKDQAQSQNLKLELDNWKEIRLKQTTRQNKSICPNFIYSIRDCLFLCVMWSR